MTAWYSRRCHLPPWGVAGRSVWRLWRHRKVPDVPRRKRAAERSTRRKGTGRHVAVAREGGRILDGHVAPAARGHRAGLTRVGRAEGDRPWREVSRVDRGAIRCRAPLRGGERDRRAERLAGPVSSGHAAAAACDGKGIRVVGLHRDSSRNPNDLLGRERIAHHNLTPPPVPRPPGAAGGFRRLRGLRAIPSTLRQRLSTRAVRRTAASRFSVPVCTRRLTAPAPATRFPAVFRNTRHGGRRCASSSSI